MEEFDFWMEVGRMSRDDEWHRTCLEMVQQREAAYFAIRDSLPPQQQEELEDYLAACQELDASLALLAYQLGRQHGGAILIAPEK